MRKPSNSTRKKPPFIKELSNSMREKTTVYERKSVSNCAMRKKTFLFRRKHLIRGKKIVTFISSGLRRRFGFYKHWLNVLMFWSKISLAWAFSFSERDQINGCLGRIETIDCFHLLHDFCSLIYCPVLEVMPVYR